VDPLPVAGAEPVPDRLGPDAGFEGLPTAEHAELPCGEPTERIFFVR